MNRRQFLGASGLMIAGNLMDPAHASAEAPNRSSPDGTLPRSPAAPSTETSQRFFPGFAEATIQTTGATINVLHGGEGPPLLLLHGHPETHVAWHKIAGELAKDYTVVLPDLRGYGDSSKPEGGEKHVNYSDRALALDQVETMRHLGFPRFFAAGHDRGARVLHRLALDHPECVRKLTLMDIAPTLTMYRETNQEFATRYVWWFFQIQPFPMPEHFIGLDPGYYLQEHLKVQGKTPGAVTPEAMAEYLRCYACTETIHAVCEDYRAGAGIDLEMDEADDKAGRKIAAAVQVLWGVKGVVGQMYDVLATWRPKCEQPVVGQALDCGHLLPEEQPGQVLAALRRFCV